MTISHRSNIRWFDEWEHKDATAVGVATDKPANTPFYEVTFEDGSDANECEDMYAATRTILANDEDILDLAGGLTDKYGNTLTFEEIRQITVYNKNETTGQVLLVGGGPDPTGGALLSDIFDGETDTRIKIKWGGLFVLVAPIAGYTITGGSADLLWIRNDGTESITYDIVIKGTRYTA